MKFGIKGAGGRFRRLLPLLIGGLLFLGTVKIAGVSVNLSNSSIGRGIFLRPPIAALARIERGSLVGVCVSEDVAMGARRAGVMHDGSCPGESEELLKYIVGVPGDVIIVTAASVSVNGSSLPNSRRMNIANLPMIPVGRYVVPQGQVWLGGSNPGSWDSRYYGAVSIVGIRGEAFPFVLFD